MQETKKEKEIRINNLFSSIYSEEEAVNNFCYLTNKKRYGGRTTEKNIRRQYSNNTLGSLLKKFDFISYNLI